VTDCHIVIALVLGVDFVCDPVCGWFMQEEMFLFIHLLLNINLFNQLPPLSPKTGFTKIKIFGFHESWGI
jgi:hypothetical protein